MSNNERIIAYLTANGRMSERDVADAVCGGLREKVESLLFTEALREDDARWGIVDPEPGGHGTWYGLW